MLEACRRLTKLSAWHLDLGTGRAAAGELGVSSEKRGEWGLAADAAKLAGALSEIQRVSVTYADALGARTVARPGKLNPTRN